MNKTLNIRAAAAVAVAALLSPVLFSCSDKNAKDADTAMTLDTIDLSAEQNATLDSLTQLGALPYNADFFYDEANKSATPEEGKWCETPSGLKYTVIEQGTGRRPSAEDEVTVNYAGELTTGESFDSSYGRGEPTSFPLNGVIKGWTEGLQLMQEGAVYEFYIPSRLAYGEQGGGGGVIPPNAPLLFKVELISVNK